MQLDNYGQELRQRILSLMKEETYKPLTVQEIQELLGFEQAAEFKELVKMLVQLEQSGYLIRSRTNRYGVPERMNHVRGKFIGHAKGFGFVAHDTEGMDDIFIPPHEEIGALIAVIFFFRVSGGISGVRREVPFTRLPESKPPRSLGSSKDNKEFDCVFPKNKKCQSVFFIHKGF